MNRSYFYLGLLFLLMVASSCSSKEDEPQPLSESYVRFKVNGEQKEFKLTNQPMGFSFDAGGPVYNAIAVLNGNVADGTKNFVSFTVRNEAPFEAGKDYQMQDPIKYKGLDMVRILFTYSDEEGNVYNAVLFQQTIAGIQVTDDARVRFTKITDNWVEGSFDAVIMGPVTSTGMRNTELKVSDGVFSLPLINTIP
jgi:hypothetical protein